MVVYAPTQDMDRTIASVRQISLGNTVKLSLMRATKSLVKMEAPAG